MPETTNYVYSGHVTLDLSKGQQVNPIQDIRILSIDHMVPINVNCELDGVPTSVTAYIDYATLRIHIPSESSTQLLGGDDLFREALVGFLGDQQDRVQRDHAELYPEFTAEHVEVQSAPHHGGE